MTENEVISTTDITVTLQRRTPEQIAEILTKENGLLMAENFNLRHECEVFKSKIQILKNKIDEDPDHRLIRMMHHTIEGLQATERNLREQIEKLKADYEASEFVRRRFQEAFGLLTTIKGDMEVRPENPIWNANELLEYVNNLKAQIPKRKFPVYISGSEEIPYGVSVNHDGSGTVIRGGFFTFQEALEWCEDYNFEVQPR